MTSSVDWGAMSTACSLSRSMAGSTSSQLSKQPFAFSASIFVPAISLGRGRRFAQIFADKSRKQRLSSFIFVLFHATVGKGGRNEDHRRFFAQDMLPGLRGCQRHRQVKIMWRTNRHHVHVGPPEQLRIIDIPT